METLSFIPAKELKRLYSLALDNFVGLQVFADAARLNTVSMIMEAGSGHIGSSFSSIDIVTYLWVRLMENPNDPSKNPSDTYFSSKGHDVPALYSLLIGLEKLPFDSIHKLRRLDGLPGHPDIHTPFIATNTGSLGMGISKAMGMAAANRLEGKKGNFYVMLGDGELQEGQIWESLQPATNGKFGEITAIIDHNKIQSDTWVKRVSDLGVFELKFHDFGWFTARVNGHNFPEMEKVFNLLKGITQTPKVIIADTIKSKGVPFMESTSFPQDGEFYPYHSGAPTPNEYKRAVLELEGKINNILVGDFNEKPVELKLENLPRRVVVPGLQKLVDSYGDELAKLGKRYPKITVLDADLKKDCGLTNFSQQFPDRFIQCGIAEQHMVSMAGGLARKGRLPIAHSFACFLTPRANEQIYNNSTEKERIIYVGALAGLIPATPGHSHQSIRDISILGDIPDLVMIEPADAPETRVALRWAIQDNLRSTYLRLASIPIDIPYHMPANYRLTEGRGVKIFDRGRDAALVSYGPVMLTECFRAGEQLARDGVNISVFNMPWLNRLDTTWVENTLSDYKYVFTVDNHYTRLGQGTQIAATLGRKGLSPHITSFGLTEIPKCGQADEVLRYHGLDATSLAKNIKTAL